MGEDEATVLGVDGCAGGWVGALVRGRTVQWLLLPDAAVILAVDAAVIAIDIPIGLPEPGDGFRRAADLAAREFLRPSAAANSVFFTPVRAVVAAETYAEANALSREHTGLGLSKQTWHITDRIAAVDAALGEFPDARVIEVHPEVSFRLLDAGINVSKRTARGVGQRISALETFVNITAALADVPPGPRLDDSSMPVQLLGQRDGGRPAVHGCSGSMPVGVRRSTPVVARCASSAERPASPAAVSRVVEKRAATTSTGARGIRCRPSVAAGCPGSPHVAQSS